MKKVFQKSFIALCVLLTVMIASSCSNGFTDLFPSAPEVTNPTNPIIPDTSMIPEYQKKSISTFGNASRIFSNPNAARFYTGQNVKSFYWDMDNNITFYGNLVEYDSIDPKLLAYIDTIQSEKNAWMHQNYGNIDYIEGKTYVEFCTYLDADHDKIIEHEIRVFDGGFWKNFDRNNWYAKAVSFSPDFKIDISHNKNVETGETAYYEYPEEYKIHLNTSIDYSKYDLVNVQAPNSDISKIGTNPKVYKYQIKEGLTDDYQPIEKHYSNEEYNIFDAYLVEYDTIAPLLKDYNKYFAGYDKGFRYNYENFTFNPNKIYLEYIVYTGDVKHKVNYIELRIRDSEGNVINNRFTPANFKRIISSIDNNMTIEQFAPFLTTESKRMSSLGDFTTSYSLSYEINDDWDYDCYVSAMLFEYNSLSVKATKQYDILKNNSSSRIRFNYDIPNGKYDSSKRYIEVLCFTKKSTGQVNRYEFNFKDPTKENTAYRMEITPEKYASFTDSNDPSIPVKSTIAEGSGNYQGPEAYKKAIEKLGNVSKIYSVQEYIPRFMTGQILRNYHGWKNKIQFEGNLIEFNSLNPTYAAYFNKQEPGNGGMNQGYNSATYDPSKFYIEVGCYKDLDNNEAIVEFDLRVIEGNPLDSNNRKIRFFDFSPDLTIDTGKNINIFTGEHAYYEYPNKIIRNTRFDYSNYDNIIVNTPNALLNKLGTINKVYKHQLKEGVTDTYEPIEMYYSNDEDMKFDSYFVEFNSIAPKLSEYLDKTYGTTNCRQYYDISYDNSKTYAEYIVYTGVDTKKVGCIELRFKQDNNQYKNIYYSPDMFEKFVNYIVGNDTLESFVPLKTTVTEKMKTLGNFKACYDSPWYNCWFYRDSEYYVESRLFEYSSLSSKALQKYDAIKTHDEATGNWWYLQNGYGNNFNNSCRYIEVIATMDRTTNEITDYEFRFKEPTTYSAHGTNMTQKQFDAFFAN